KMHFDRVTIHTDGACLGNPGPGGYGVVVQSGTGRMELSGGFRLTTNNRMEILAAIIALESLVQGSVVVLSRDSQYLVRARTEGWALKWRANGWMRNNKERAQNADLWVRLIAAAARHIVEFVWVKAHAGNIENERCDSLATSAARQAELLVDEEYER